MYYLVLGFDCEKISAWDFFFSYFLFSFNNF